MKKRNIQRWIKRVSCRVGALLSTCLILSTMVIPAFASNNASTQKWYVADEAQLVSESGSTVRYLKLTPYVDGAEYTYTALSRLTSLSLTLPQSNTSSPVSYSARFVLPLNYPDWWRSNLPIGAYTYVDFTLVSLASSTSLTGPYNSLSSGYVYFLDLSTSLNSSFSTQSPQIMDWGSNGFDSPSIRSSSFSSSYPFFAVTGFSGDPAGIGPFNYSADVSASYRFNISNTGNLVLAPYAAFGSSPPSSLFAVTNLSNLSSDNFCIAICGRDVNYYYKSQFKLSFWVDANKLPAGLQVGDEFPANSDAFDDMRDELIKQFPEISENVENGKDTINGWNDTETVDTDVANTSLSVINALFQNLGQFLAIVSLMIFGAVVLRMLVRKAVDG